MSLVGNQPLYPCSCLYFYTDRFTCIYGTWYICSFGIWSLSFVKGPSKCCLAPVVCCPSFCVCACALSCVEWFPSYKLCGFFLREPVQIIHLRALWSSRPFSVLSSYYTLNVSWHHRCFSRRSLRCFKKVLELVLIPKSSCSSNTFLALPIYILSSWCIRCFL